MPPSPPGVMRPAWSAPREAGRPPGPSPRIGQREPSASWLRDTQAALALNHRPASPPPARASPPPARAPPVRPFARFCVGELVTGARTYRRKGECVVRGSFPLGSLTGETRSLLVQGSGDARRLRGWHGRPWITLRESRYAAWGFQGCASGGPVRTGRSHAVGVTCRAGGRGERGSVGTEFQPRRSAGSADSAADADAG